MNSSELIRELQEFDPKTEVVIVASVDMGPDETEMVIEDGDIATILQVRSGFNLVHIEVTFEEEDGQD